MAERTIIFTGTFLSMNNKKIDLLQFKETLPENSYSASEGNKVHIFKVAYLENYLYLTFGDGSAMPRNPNVVNIETNLLEPNPRQANQVEARETFGIIDFKTGFLWLSNSRKKTFVLDFLKDRFINIQFSSKDVYDEEKFISTLKRLDDIKVSTVPNLFSQTGVLTEVLTDEINGYEATLATLHFHYQEKFIGKNLLKKISNIFQNRSNFNNIVISGRDENNLGMLFNSDGFSRKIEFKALIDENQMCVAEDVFTKLISKIEDENS